MEKIIEPYNRVIGITGIIGSGKTTVCDLLEELGAYVIHADELSARVLQPEYENFDKIKNQILEFLKPEVPSETLDRLFPNNRLNRKLLGEIIFSSPDLTKKINSLIHPEVRKLFEKQIYLITDPGRIIIYDVPLLYETNLDKLLKKNIVVFLDEETAIERASIRMNLSKAEVKKRMNRQISIEKKRNMADYVVNNTGDMLQLKEEVTRLWKYLQDII